MSSIVHMNDDEIEIARLLARRRYSKNRSAGVKGYQNTTRLDEETKEAISILGEWALYRLFNFYPPTSQSPNVAGEPDLVTFSGKSIEIKTTDRANGNLCVNVESFERYRDLYVLMQYAPVVNGAYLSYVGAASRAEVESAQVMDNYTTPFYLVTRDNLHKDYAKLKEFILWS